MAYADNIKQLPPVNHLTALELLNTSGEVVATIENQPGKAGSLAVYAALYAKHGGITVLAAQEGLELFAEHTADAHAHPGSHPNIDRLLKVVSTGEGFSVKLTTA